MSEPASVQSRTLLDVVALACLAFLATVVLAASWGRWLDPILDSGRDLYIPERLLAGKVLYRDFQYYYPPVAPYLLALGTLLAGSSLSGYTWMGVAVGLFAMLAIYFLVRELAGRVAATTASAMFVTLSLTAATNWGSNFIFPYAHAATIGMMFVLLYLLFMARYLFRTHAAVDYSVAIACGILAAGSKLEFAVTFAASFAYVLALHRPPRKLVFAGVLAILGSFAVTWVAFAGGGPGHHWLWDNVLLITKQPRSATFNAIVQGTNRIGPNLMESALGAVIVIAFVILLAMFTRVRRHGIIALLGIAIVALTIYASDDKFFRAWSILQFALVPFALRRPRSPLAFLLITSILISLRIILNLTPAWYGFFLMVPVYALIVYVLFDFLPSHGIYSKRMALAWLPLLAVLMIRTQIHQRSIWSHCVYPVVTSRGTFLDWNGDRAAILNEFVGGARGVRSLVVIPESPTLNYFTRIENPLPYQMFTPIVSDFDWLERDMISAFDEKKPEYVAFVPRPVGEFGSRGFGIDYNRKLAAYIRSHYRVTRAWRRPGFSLILGKLAGTAQPRDRATDQRHIN